MLYLFHGTNTNKVADQTNKLVAGLLVKRPMAQVFSFDGEVLSESELDALIEAQGLFVEKHIVVLRQVFLNEETRSIVVPRLKRIAETQNIFVIAEGKLLAEHKKVLEKHAHQTEEHALKKVEKESFNVFALSDALCARNKQMLWSLYMQALRAGLEPESIHGTLHWSVRTLLSVVRSKSFEESGQKQFTYNKYKHTASIFKEEELVRFSRELISIYHDARRGGLELTLALERWILAL